MTDREVVQLLLQIVAVVPVTASALWIWVAHVDPKLLERGPTWRSRQNFLGDWQDGQGKWERRLMMTWTFLAAMGLLVFGYAGFWALLRLFVGSATAAEFAIIPALGFLWAGGSILNFERST